MKQNEGPALNTGELENKSQEGWQGGGLQPMEEEQMNWYGNIIFHFPGRYFKHKQNTSDTV